VQKEQPMVAHHRHRGVGGSKQAEVVLLLI
jgi:hypothetical protein